jgi:hypothetical protein
MKLDQWHPFPLLKNPEPGQAGNGVFYFHFFLFLVFNECAVTP